MTDPVASVRAGTAEPRVRDVLETLAYDLKVRHCGPVGQGSVDTQEFSGPEPGQRAALIVTECADRPGRWPWIAVRRETDWEAVGVVFEAEEVTEAPGGDLSPQETWVDFHSTADGGTWVQFQISRRIWRTDGTRGSRQVTAVLCWQSGSGSLCSRGIPVRHEGSDGLWLLRTTGLERGRIRVETIAGSPPEHLLGEFGVREVPRRGGASGR